MKKKHFKPLKRKYSFTKCLINIWNSLPPDTYEIRNLVRAQQDSNQTPIWILVRFTGKTGKLPRYEILEEVLTKIWGCKGSWICPFQVNERKKITTKWLDNRRQSSFATHCCMCGQYGAFRSLFLVQAFCRAGVWWRRVFSVMVCVFWIMVFEEFGNKAAGFQFLFCHWFVFGCFTPCLLLQFSYLNIGRCFGAALWATRLLRLNRFLFVIHLNVLRWSALLIPVQGKSPGGVIGSGVTMFLHYFRCDWLERGSCISTQAFSCLMLLCYCTAMPIVLRNMLMGQDPLCETLKNRLKKWYLPLPTLFALASHFLCANIPPPPNQCW